MYQQSVMIPISTIDKVIDFNLTDIFIYFEPYRCYRFHIVFTAKQAGDGTLIEGQIQPIELLEIV